VLSTNGGLTSKVTLPYLPGTSSLFYRQCKAIRNHLVYGRNTLTPSSGISV
jgi:hypothetical protein